jgi:hypothetical protein
MSGTDEELNGLLDQFEKNQKGKAQGRRAAVTEEDKWIAKFEEVRRNVIRPTLEKLGEQIRKRDHDFNIVETQFRRDNRAIPDEASIRMDIYLATERTRTGIGMDRRPFLGFTTHHRSEMVQVTVSDMTASGGVISKIGEYPLESIDAFLVREKFIVVWNRLLHK